MIALSEPFINGNEWKYIKECLDSNWVSSAGKFVGAFEDKICEFTGVKHAIACINGTSALHISLIVAGVVANDEVIVPTLTFIAPVNAIKYVNADPVFMDCDNYYNIDVQKVARFLENETYIKDGFTYNKKTFKRISAIIPVHVFGNAVQMESLQQLCNQYNIAMIEDATEALGTWYTSGSLAGKHAGTTGVLGCLSFNGNKIITTGAGGMILTNDSGLAERCKYLTTQAKDDPINYIHESVGYNYRMSNIQAAFGLAQLEQLPSFLDRKKQNYNVYKSKLQQYKDIKIKDVPAYAANNYWMYALMLNGKIGKRGFGPLIKTLEENGIQTRPVWQLNHLQTPYLKYQAYEISNALDLRNRTLNIPCSVGLTNDEIDHVVTVLLEEIR